MWQIKESLFDKEKIAHYGNQFLIGHLKLGVRGTLDEFRKSEMASINLPMIYDQVGEGWRESVNAMNVLFTRVKVNGKILHVNFSSIVGHEQILDMSCGLMKRRTVFLEDNIYITIESERFVNQEGSREIYGLYRVSLSDDAHLEIESGIDYDIWDLHGPHLHDFTFSRSPHLAVRGISHEKGYIITASKSIIPDFTCQKEDIHEQKIFGKRFTIDAKKDYVYTIESYSFIGVNSNTIDDQNNLENMIYLGYQKALTHQKDYWSKLWNISDVIIEGNIEAQRALRYSIYHLLILAPKVNYSESIPARGISGQTYKGAIFWDTEIFMLPFYLNTDIMSAKSIIEYRIKGLEGAKQKAKSYGYQGAFYAWESHEDGYDACTDYNVTDVFTGRPVRTYFRDKQIHISGDIVYAIESYISKTNDFAILKKGALEVIFEVARFYIDYGHYAPIKDRFEIHDVLGPDEYHERVHNNAFTNQLIKMVFDSVIKYENYFHDEKSSYFDELVNRLNYHKTLIFIKTYRPKLFLQNPTINGLIEQFDGYFCLKDITIEDLLMKRIHPN
ncbi:MAG: hypothetical protein RBT45_07500 [Acholeplasmataceae bacterium]|jgi:kojibiose phosphorylase/nigerose phosphorylase|nr:hypothetical protein [Acholeplasmataceae bacterium]